MNYFVHRTNSSPGEIVSNLKIAKAQKHHSGTYTCTVDQLATASVTLHILNGKWTRVFYIGAVGLGIWFLKQNDLYAKRCVVPNGTEISA